jgi:hypothetical protein
VVQVRPRPGYTRHTAYIKGVFNGCYEESVFFLISPNNGSSPYRHHNFNGLYTLQPVRVSTVILKVSI